MVFKDLAELTEKIDLKGESVPRELLKHLPTGTQACDCGACDCDCCVEGYCICDDSVAGIESKPSEKYAPFA